MAAVLVKIYHILGDISLAFEGNLGQENSEIVEMREEVLFKPIPNHSIDKENLKNDAKNIHSDFKKAVNEYFKERELA